MDLTTLMQQNIENLNRMKEEFKKAQSVEQKTASYQGFFGSIENLNKIRNVQSISQSVKDKLKDIILAAGTEAKGMKDELMGQKQQPSPVSQSAPNKSPSQHSNHDKPQDNSENGKEKKEFEDALKGAIITEKPDVKWEDVAGLKMAKQTLKEAIIFPTKFPEIFVGLRKPWKGILLYGVG